ncbi:MAG: hypothetical protein K2W91_10570 [Novosphingobium sp.]|nr:hypothetical protein [Novosphingobium sp.]
MGLDQRMILKRLPPSITGFFDHLEPPRSVESRSFTEACHLVAQFEGGVVEDIDLSLLGRSYYSATVRTPSDHVSMLANSVYPYLAFVRPHAFGVIIPELSFVAPVRLASSISSLTYFRSLDAAWLETELSTELLADLAQVELDQVKYWKPARVGEVIFNNWD